MATGHVSENGLAKGDWSSSELLRLYGTGLWKGISRIREAFWRLVWFKVVCWACLGCGIEATTTGLGDGSIYWFT